MWEYFNQQQNITANYKKRKLLALVMYTSFNSTDTKAYPDWHLVAADALGHNLEFIFSTFETFYFTKILA